MYLWSTGWVYYEGDQGDFVSEDLVVEGTMQGESIAQVFRSYGYQYCGKDIKTSWIFCF